MFGLAQLYQLRGRVGRSKLRAYALFTLPAQQKITAQAERRLTVLQSLETLGAGFQLASHDLDIRGAGNLLGEEQSGHIKEVGFELYQSMLEEAILNLKAGVTEPAADRWSPQITVGMPVMIPEDYVADLSVRLSLYRRLADLDTDELRSGQVLWATIDSPWVHRVDRDAFGHALAQVRAIEPRMVCSSHLPPAPGVMLDLFVASLAMVPGADPFVGPDHAALEAMLAGISQVPAAIDG